MGDKMLIKVLELLLSRKRNNNYELRHIIFSLLLQSMFLYLLYKSIFNLWILYGCIFGNSIDSYSTEPQYWNAYWILSKSCRNSNPILLGIRNQDLNSNRTIIITKEGILYNQIATKKYCSQCSKQTKKIYVHLCNKRELC